MAHPSLTLVSRTVAIPALDVATRQAMWELFHCYYAEVERETFEQDLVPKSHVILLLDSGDGSLQGFSTLQIYRRTIQGRAVGVLYSGDTIVGQAYWGQTALQRAWLAYAMRVKARYPLLPVYWFLIAKGYKTYLLLSRNFPEYWPRWDRPLPPWQRELLDALATEKFGREYLPAWGLIRHEACQGRLREGVAPITEEQLTHPDLRYFAERNPGHEEGDELCCLGRIDLALARFYLAKLAKRTLRRATGTWRRRP